MAMRRCSECGRSISTDARACPHCGKRYGGIVGPFFAVLVLIVGVAYCATRFVSSEVESFVLKRSDGTLSAKRAEALGVLIRRAGFECPQVNAVLDHVSAQGVEGSKVFCGPVEDSTGRFKRAFWVIIGDKAAEVDFCDQKPGCPNHLGEQ